MNIRFPFREVEPFTITTDGSGDGNATTTDLLRGALWGYVVDFGTAGASTVLTGYVVGGAADDTDLLVFTSAAGNTDGIRHPRLISVLASDGTAGTGELFPAIPGRKFKVVAASAGGIATITIKLIVIQ